MIVRATAPAPLPKEQILAAPASRWDVTRTYRTPDGQTHVDKFDVSDSEIRLILRTINERIRQIEEKPGWRVRSWKIEHDALVDLLCIIDV